MSTRRSVSGLVAAVLAVLALSMTLMSPAASASAAVLAIRGGHTVYSSSGQTCVIAFNAQGGGFQYGITGRNCTNAPGATWYAEASRTTPIGVTPNMPYPHDTYALIRYTNTSLTYPGEVTLLNGTVVDITGAADPVLGQPLCHVGRTTGSRCGVVQQTGMLYIPFDGTRFTGVFRANNCDEPGDLGGPAYSGSTAIGLIVDGSGNCSVGGYSLYQPITKILSADPSHLTLY